MRLRTATGIAFAWMMGILWVASTSGQAQPAGPQRAEEVFKNIQVLRGIPVDEFMDTMGIMSAALGFDCAECHVAAGTDQVDWAFDTPRKRTARRMTLMVATINKTHFGGRQMVTCWTCHRGRDLPVVTPGIDTVYGEPILEADDIIRESFPGEPPPERILDRYVEALGGATRLAAVTSFVATGTSENFRGFGGGGQVTVYAKAPDQRATIITFPGNPDRGDSVRTFDGRVGWMKTPLAVVNEYQIGGMELDGARLDAQLSFPAQIRKVLTNLRTGSPQFIGDREVQVVQGTGSRGVVATLYFDKQTGLLARMVRFGGSPIGRAPTQVDVSDYRDVAGAGIKMPYRWIFGWLNGRDSFELKEVRVNVPIDAAVFGRPVSRK